MNEKEKNLKSLSSETVRHMAELSQLSLNEEEVEMFGRQFAVILGYMEVLQNVDTRGIEPLYTCAQNFAYKRKDNAVNMRSRKEILANAPETDGESFMVPRII